MCDIVLEKAKGCGRKINRASVYAKAAVRRVLQKGVMGNFAEFTRRYL